MLMVLSFLLRKYVLLKNIAMTKIRQKLVTILLATVIDQPA